MECRKNKNRAGQFKYATELSVDLFEALLKKERRWLGVNLKTA
ncbi:MAG: hypothetical protein OFPII_13010 [Osedax symbiont Rs1]|nr:MAG: hypothetical protein OFPII_13010 [Osedax symbiont Rs1]